MRCSVPKCFNFPAPHRFPKDKHLLKRWLAAIGEPDFIPKVSSRICKDHFTPEDFTMPKESVRSNPSPSLKKTAVPSIFSRNKKQSVFSEHSKAVHKKITLVKQQQGRPAPPPLVVYPVDHTSSKVTPNQSLQSNSMNPVVSLRTSMVYCPISTKLVGGRLTKEEGTQCSLCPCGNIVQRVSLDGQSSEHSLVKLDLQIAYFRIEHLIDKPDELKFYTGFEDYNGFMTVFNLLGDRVNRLAYFPTFQIDTEPRLLSPANEFFLTLVKLRRNMSNEEVQFRFGIASTLSRSIFITWVNFLFCRFKAFNVLDPTKVDVKVTKEKSKFKNESGCSAVIIDCAAVKIENSESIIIQPQSFSNNKSSALKVLVVISPRGTVNFVSDAYVDLSSDRELFEKCGKLNLLKQLDKNVKEQGKISVRSPNSFNNDICPSWQGQAKSPAGVCNTGIPIKKVMGLSNTYKILEGHSIVNQAQLTSRIIFVCFMLANFRSNFVV